MFLVLFHLFCVSASASNATVATVIFPAKPGVESTEVLSSGGTIQGYIVSSINSQEGGIYKYNSSGILVSGFNSSLAPATWTAGLAITADQTTLFAAHLDNKVTSYTIGASALTKITDYNPGFNPNGLCLSDDGSKLFVAAHGWSINPQLLAQQQDPVSKDPNSDGGGFAIISLGSGTVQTVFTNQSNTRAPNGCTVYGNMVYFAMFQQGIGSYDIGSGTFTNTVSWSQSLKTAQTGSPRLAGDGIAVYDGLFYVSCWTMTAAQGSVAPGPTSAIYQCDPNGNTCISFSSMAAADISIYSNMIVAPRILEAKVSTIELSLATTTATSPTSTFSATSESKFGSPSVVIYAATSALFLQILSF